MALILNVPDEMSSQGRVRVPTLQVKPSDTVARLQERFGDMRLEAGVKGNVGGFAEMWQ